MCVGRCKRLFVVCAVVVERGLPLLLPHPGRGPAQSAERVWPKRGSDAKGRSLSASPREADSFVEGANEKETVVKL